MTPSLNHRGFSIVEAVATVFITSMIMLVSVSSFSAFSRYLHNATVRQQATSDADRTMATMIANLQKAKASSVTICSCGAADCGVNNACVDNASPGTPPNSRIQFTTLDEPLFPSAFFWENGTVYFLPGAALRSMQAVTRAQKLTDNVTGLLFTGDGTDFSHVRITLRLDVPISPTSFATVLLPNQVAVLVQ